MKSILQYICSERRLAGGPAGDGSQCSAGVREGGLCAALPRRAPSVRYAKFIASIDLFAKNTLYSAVLRLWNLKKIVT